MKVFGIAGWSGSGKTTLIEQLIPVLKQRGLRVSVIKQANRKFNLDQPGKDSWRHREAGAREALLSCPERWAYIHELRDETEPTLSECLTRLTPVDLVLVEGFKHETLPRLEVHHPGVDRLPLAETEDAILAVASPQPVALCDRPSLVWLELQLPIAPTATEAIADFVLTHAVEARA